MTEQSLSGLDMDLANIFGDELFVDTTNINDSVGEILGNTPNEFSMPNLEVPTTNQAPVEALFEIPSLDEIQIEQPSTETINTQEYTIPSLDDIASGLSEPTLHQEPQPTIVVERPNIESVASINNYQQAYSPTPVAMPETNGTIDIGEMTKEERVETINVFLEDYEEKSVEVTTNEDSGETEDGSFKTLQVILNTEVLDNTEAPRAKTSFEQQLSNLNATKEAKSTQVGIVGDKRQVEENDEFNFSPYLTHQQLIKQYKQYKTDLSKAYAISIKELDANKKALDKKNDADSKKLENIFIAEITKRFNEVENKKSGGDMDVVKALLTSLTNELNKNI